MTELPYGRLPYPLGFVHPATILDTHPMPLRGDPTATLDDACHVLRVQSPRTSRADAGPLVREDAHALIAEHTTLRAALDGASEVSLRTCVLPTRTPGNRPHDALNLPRTSQHLNEAIT